MGSIKTDAVQVGGLGKREGSPFHFASQLTSWFFFKEIDFVVVVVLTELQKF